MKNYRFFLSIIRSFVHSFVSIVHFVSLENAYAYVSHFICTWVFFSLSLDTFSLKLLAIAENWKLLGWNFSLLHRFYAIFSINVEIIAHWILRTCQTSDSWKFHTNKRWEFAHIFRSISQNPRRRMGRVIVGYIFWNGKIDRKKPQPLPRIKYADIQSIQWLVMLSLLLRCLYCLCHGFECFIWNSLSRVCMWCMDG